MSGGREPLSSTKIDIVKRLRGAAEYAREFGIPQSADIHDCAADEIERLRAAADGVSPPPPRADVLRELDERCEKAEGTLISEAANAGGGQETTRLEGKRQGVSLVRDYLRELRGASGPLPPPPQDEAMESWLAETNVPKYLDELSDPALAIVSIAEDPSVLDVLIYLARRASAAPEHLADAVRRVLDMKPADLTDATAVVAELVATRTILRSALAASGPLPERGPTRYNGQWEEAEIALRDVLDAEDALEVLQILQARGFQSPPERGDVAEQLAEALRDLVAEDERFFENDDAGNYPELNRARAALAAFSAPRTPEGTTG